MASLLKSAILREGIAHIEDLPLQDFITAVETLKDKVVTEKLDGSNLWFGVDDKGFFTSREGKSRKGTRFYSVSDYPLVANYNGFRAAHLALQKAESIIKSHISNGEMVEMEVLFGRQPNTVTYGHEDKNYIVLLRGVEGTPQKKVDALSKALDGKSAKVSSVVITSADGDKLEQKDETTTWQFTQVKPVPTKDVDITPALAKLKELKDYLGQANKQIDNKTNQDVAELNLNQVPKEQRPAAKEEREAVLDFIMKTYKQPIKEILLHTLVRKVKPFLQSQDLHPDEDIGVEGVVATDPKSGDMIKIVDKDVFTAINTFNNFIRSNVAGLVRTDDQDAPIELRGGAFGQAKIRIANLLGLKELAISSSSRRILLKFKKATPAETATAVADSLNVADYAAIRTKASAILMNSLKEIDQILTEFIEHVDTYKLKLKTGKEIGISPEVMKRTLTAFAETKRDINQINTAVLKSRNLPEMIMALYGRTIQGLFAGSDTDVSEAIELKMLKMLEDGDGDAGGTGADADGPDGDGDVDDGVTSSTAIAPLQMRLMGGRLVTRRPRKFVKKKKFALSTVKEGASLLQLVEFDSTAVDSTGNQFAKDVDDSASAKSDVEFKSLRNQLKQSGDELTQQDVTDYLDKAHELNDMVDTVTFGMEMDDGSVVKVFVNATQADAFEKALADRLGAEDDVEKVIDELANDFDIVDVEWPEGIASDEAPVGVDQNGEVTADGESPVDDAESSGEDGQITSTVDANGDEQVSPVIDLSGENGDDNEEDDGNLMKSINDIANGQTKPGDEEPASGEPEDKEGDASGPDLGMLDNGDETAGGEDKGEDTDADTSDNDSTPPKDEKSDTGDSDTETNDTPPDDEGGADLGDLESPSDEDDDEGKKAKPKEKKAKKKKPEDDTSSEETDQTEESAMSYGQRFKEKLLAEKVAPKPAAKEPAVEDSQDFPDGVKKLMVEFPTKGAKMMIGLMFALGVPLEAMQMKKADLKKSTDVAGDQYMKDSQLRTWIKKLIMSIQSAQSASVKESLDDELSNLLQKLIFGILRKIGLTDSIEKMARSSIRKAVKNMAAIAQGDSKVRTNLKIVGEMLGLDATTGAMQEDINEGKNHLGDKEYQTYDSWRAACKKVAPNGHMAGDKDIGEWHVGEKPFKAGKTFAVGEWGGEKGSVYADAAEIVAKAAKKEEVKEAKTEKKVEDMTSEEFEKHLKKHGISGMAAVALGRKRRELMKAKEKEIKEAGFTPTPTAPATPDADQDDWISKVKKVSATLGVPEWALSTRGSQVDAAIRKRKLKIKNYSTVMMQMDRLLKLIGDINLAEDTE